MYSVQHLRQAPSHAFYCWSQDQLLQAVLFALSRREKTAAVLFTDGTKEAFSGIDTSVTFNGLVEYISAEARRVLRPIWNVMSMPGCSEPELRTASWLADYDVKVHAFSPAADVEVYLRDDIVVHDSGDYSRWRVGGRLADTVDAGVEKVMLQRMPDGYDPEMDRKVEVWDFIGDMLHLEDGDRDDLLRLFDVPVYDTAAPVTLYVHQEPDRARYGEDAVPACRKAVERLLEAMAGAGRRIVFKGHHKRSWEPIGPWAHFPSHAPAELSALAIPSLESVVSVRSAVIDRLDGRFNCINGLSLATSRKMNLARDRKIREMSFDAYIAGVKRLAAELSVDIDPV